MCYNIIMIYSIDRLKQPKHIIVCEKDPSRIDFVRKHYPEVLVCEPENCKEFTLRHSDHGGADVVLEVAGAKDTFRLAWECARPNAPDRLLEITVKNNITLTIFSAYQARSSPSESVNRLQSSGH